ncbi:hypothetical protein LCGC14_1084090 [marine sediment metagenome]|uniref:Uncharacterized protein n=1 Tax=marine sediment metagenome TaxID=412755 RepID=A0A0F9PXH9_9ZZZZ
MTTFEQYYADNFQRWVDLLTKYIHDREEAEDRVQNIFVSLLPREKLCRDLIAEGKINAYVWGSVIRQRANVFRGQYKRVHTVSIDADNVDFLSSIQGNNQDITVTEKAELEDFYKKAIELLRNPRKPLLKCGFGTVGEVRQYIFIQYARNGRTFQEIGELIGTTYQNVAVHYKKIIVILTPMIEEFIEGKIK